MMSISRKYGMFTAPIAYLIDDRGIIAADVAGAADTIPALATGKGQTMREQIQARLDELKAEFETGQAELQKLERQRTYLHETVLQIGGAIHVLEELLRERHPDNKYREAGAGEAEAAATQANGADGKQTEIPLRKE
jgi:hypothetical protein